MGVSLNEFRFRPGIRMQQHKNCRDGYRCQGPGCTVKTGKTTAKREGKRHGR